MIWITHPNSILYGSYGRFGVGNFPDFPTEFQKLLFFVSYIILKCLRLRDVTLGTVDIQLNISNLDGINIFLEEGRIM